MTEEPGGGGGRSAEDTVELVTRRLAGGATGGARAAIAAVARHTPLLSSRSLSERCGGRVALKAENLQRTGSFKLRGALTKLALLEAEGGAGAGSGHEAPRGVVAGSAGNHAQSLAYAARAHSLPCEVFMPHSASISKVAAVRGFGGTVTFAGGSVDECVAAARVSSQQTGAVFVHPFDDPDVIVGQSTLGAELIEDCDDLAMVIVPVGGGGLISGVAGAVRQAAGARVRVVGVQAERCAAFPASLAAHAAVPSQGVATIADGIAIKRPGEITLALVERWVDEVCTVGEDEIAEAMALLLERAKLVVEGAGAAAVAALLAGTVQPASSGTTVVVLSGGNVDPGLLARVVQRHETEQGRRLRLFTRISDQPGGLAALLTRVAETGGNLITVEHVRDGTGLHVQETGVELVLEIRDHEHGATIVHALEEADYVVEQLDAEVGAPRTRR